MRLAKMALLQAILIPVLWCGVFIAVWINTCIKLINECQINDFIWLWNKIIFLEIKNDHAQGLEFMNFEKG